MKERGFIHIPILIILITLVAVGTAILANQNPLPDVKGTLIVHEDSDDGDSNSSGSGSSGSGSSGSGSDSGSSDETKTITPSGVRIETESEKDEQKTEVRFGEGEKIKTEIEEGRTRIDVYSGGVKVRYEIRDGRVTIKAETEEGEEVEEQEVVKIVDRIDKTGIKVATEGGRLLVARGGVGASFNFPLQIDLATNALIVTTPTGTRTVTVFPDQAVQNMLAANVISRLGATAITEAVREGQVATVSGIINLGLRNNIPVYEIAGIRDFKLLGFIPISQPVTAIVSAETGQVIATDQSFLTRIINLLSP